MMDGEDSGPAEEIENFYGVYLLVSQNPRYKGRTYVGFTVDPIRRLKQHNGGMPMIAKAS
jgi:predicted GIY-YIG superfamily endonuclease